MLTKSLLALTLLTALSAGAQAGSTITDRSYWPNEAKRTTQAEMGIWQRGPYSAFAYDRGTPGYHAAITPVEGRPAWRYQGGPKSR